MYIDRYSNSSKSLYGHSPYYAPNFNHTYFNSPLFLKPSLASNDDYTLGAVSYAENIKNPSSSIQATIPISNNILAQKTSPNANNSHHTKNSYNDKTSSFDFKRLFNMSGNTISIFGFSVDIDDLIIIGLLIFLIYEKCDDIYLIILLGLLFFDIKLDFWK